MPVSVVIGSQWGDEGKGKIVDLIAKDVDIVARYQGGANAGHTICFDEKKFVLHLVPSGIFQPGVSCVIGNGVVIDPVAVLKEISMIKDLGYEVEGRLLISHNAHVIMPYHKHLDLARERYREAGAIGTTGRGIGPAYMDKFARTGIRVVDLLNRDILAAKIRTSLEEKNAVLKAVYGADEMNIEAMVEEYVEFDRFIDPYVTDTALYLNRALKAGKRVLAEGAQGSLLDVDFGTYPYVTSSHPTVGGCCTGLGVPPMAIDRVIGITKAYCTRVGNGPFVTELNDETGETLRRIGHEFGATTGRPRRTGWLDLVALRYSAMINGLTELAITKLDVLDDMDEILVCTAYEIDGKRTTRFSTDVAALERATPIYQSFKGWKTSLEGVSSVEALPETARTYLQFIEQEVEVPIRSISTSPKREDTLTDVYL